MKLTMLIMALLITNMQAVTARQALVLDYAKSKGCYMNTEQLLGNGLWWLRINRGLNGYGRVIRPNGNTNDGDVTSVENGICIACTLTIE